MVPLGLFDMLESFNTPFFDLFFSHFVESLLRSVGSLAPRKSELNQQLSKLIQASDGILGKIWIGQNPREMMNGVVQIDALFFY